MSDRGGKAHISSQKESIYGSFSPGRGKWAKCVILAVMKTYMLTRRGLVAHFHFLFSPPYLLLGGKSRWKIQTILDLRCLILIPCYCINLMGAFRGTKAVWIWKDLLSILADYFRKKGKVCLAVFYFCKCIKSSFLTNSTKRIIERKTLHYM